MTDNHKDDMHIHGNVRKLVQIGKVDGGVTIQDTLETYACCPVCERNNKVEKVSAILDRETHNVNGITIEKRSYQDKDGRSYTSTEKVPFTGTQSSVLAMKLKPPLQPQAKGKPSWVWWLGFLLLPLYACSGFAYVLGLWNDIYLPVTTILVFRTASFIGSLFLIFCLVLLFKKYKKKEDLYNLEVKRVKEQEYPKWQKAMERWEKLYYCFTDGFVFIPGENTYAELSSINEYVYHLV